MQLSEGNVSLAARNVSLAARRLTIGETPEMLDTTACNLLSPCFIEMLDTTGLQPVVSALHAPVQRKILRC